MRLYMHIYSSLWYGELSTSAFIEVMRIIFIFLRPGEAEMSALSPVMALIPTSGYFLVEETSFTNPPGCLKLINVYMYWRLIFGTVSSKIGLVGL